MTKHSRTLFLLNFDSERFDTIYKSFSLFYGSKFCISNVTSPDGISELDSNQYNAILVYIEKDQLSTRKLLWLLKNRFPQLPLILCSDDKTFAQLAWHIDALYFLLFPISRRSLANMITRIDSSYKIEPPKLKFNHLSGFYLINYDEICYCKSDGNYTDIVLSNNNTIMVSKKIKDVAQKIAIFPHIIRIGKSYMINLEKVSRIDESYIFLRGDEKTIKLKLSAVYLRRIKEIMLWYSV